MASFGGAIKLTGGKEYQATLKSISQTLRECGSEMKVVSSEFSKNDNTTSSLQAKQERLNAILEKQKSALANVTTAYNQFNAKVQVQAQEHQKLVAEYDKEKAKLDTLGKTVGTTSKEYQDQKAKVEELALKVAKSTDNYNQNEVALSKLKTQLNTAQAEVNKTASEMDNLGKETEETASQMTKASAGGFTVFKGMLANLGTQAIMGAINGLKSLGSAMISVGKQALTSYADYEQLVGGVETLFGDSASIVEEYARNSYKTAGLSANEYMETVTSFSASLISSLGGDTAKASEYGNRAITDMSDNANKMGTDISMIQNAYQGFAKQNYTMLDNLKLGYGGTKTEMQRLIQDASQLTDVQKELGITVDANDMSFGNIVNAISVVQKNMGIMGTTAKESSQTISGSISSMQSAWQNLLTGIADDNADFDSLINNFVDSLVTMLNNILPRVTTIIKGLGQTVSQLLTTIVPQLVQMIPPLLQESLPILLNAVKTVIQTVLEVLPQVVDIINKATPQILTAILSLLPAVLDAGIKIILSLIQGLSDTVPKLLDMLPNIIVQLVTTILDNLPLILKAGIELVVALITGLLKAIPQLIESVPELIDSIVTTIFELLPLIIESAVDIIGALVQGLISAIPKIIATVPKIIVAIVQTLVTNFPKLIEKGKEIITKITDGITSFMGKVGPKAKEIVGKIGEGLKELPSKMLEIGKNVVRGIFNGISDMKNWLFDKIKGFKDQVLNKFKSFFGIHSPSTLFKKQIGENLALGIGEGFTDEMANVTKEMQGAMPTSFDTSINTGTSGVSSMGANYNYDTLVSAFEVALANMKIVLDDEVAGKFVTKTVADAIYT